MSNTNYILAGAGLLLITFAVACLHVYLRMKELKTLDLDEEERKKVKDLARNPYLDRGFDILVFFLFVSAAQLIILRLQGGCPLKSAYPRIIFFSGLSLIPLALSFVWNALPWGRKGDIDDELIKLGKIQPTKEYRLYRIMSRPWLGVFYWLFYAWAAVCVYLNVA
ncbi:hypothetical protein GF359_10395 [candidate division WOR-3 bacterium]|uniref:Uncharacterized protein n=1 Tax=candidate division WOR-3 bacterium TaxID=2052148 RepID=A0A9D5QF33_UNCW3|nr:hypothetical protein [candidate division WOR-3 bacterium]MBD3365610.1 hypothetical protein [candidate division WOR-3 bacterium]